MDLLPRLDDGKPLPQHVEAAQFRRLLGLDHVPPSELQILAWNTLKLARLNLAEKLEGQKKFEEALTHYHDMVEQGKQMRKVVWEPESELHTLINNLALCYKRGGKFEQAIEWYQKGLDMCAQEDPGSTMERMIRDNLDTMLNTGKAGPVGQTTAKRCCWNCGVSPNSNPSVKLLCCARCKELKLAVYAYYCSAECQREDWKRRHKLYHQEIKDAKKTAVRNNFQPLSEETQAVLNDPDYVPDSDYASLLSLSAQCTEQGKHHKEKKLLKKAIKMEPNNPVAHHNLAICLSNSHEYEESVKEFSNAMRLVGAKPPKYANANEIWARSAASIFAMFTRRSECSCIQKPIWMTDHKELELVAKRVVEVVPSFNEGWAMLGATLEDVNPERAIECYERAALVSEIDSNVTRFQQEAVRVRSKLLQVN